MRVGDMQSCKCYNLGLKDMVLKLSGTHRQPGGGPRRRGGSPPPTRTTSLYRSGYYRPGVVQDDMAVPPATYLGHGHGGGASSTASSTPAWERPPGNGDAAARGEWVAQVEPGVQITFVSLSGTGGGAGGGNDLKRIRFSREMYDKWQAQRWWAENNERIMELYNVRRFSPRHDHVLPPSSDAGDPEQRESFYSQMGSTRASSPAATPSPAPETSATWAAAFARAAPPPPPSAARQHSFRGPLSPPPPSSSNPSERAWQQQKQSQQNDGGVEPARTTTSSCRDDDASVSNASELEVTEWVIQDQPGVYITVRELPDGARELRRVRFSREKFAELNAKLWWEENKERIHAQYL
ncbi:protein Brevis radix-like 4 isoform X3 [Brachypodium distachyon]|uniref:protein Brevis radix-like 4 isoform X3 n=1 Tax=Brachypodium distachyon TaxID=15368 RepID=UPI00071DF54A|nr:protein Brevis radix-like 4 isoform X3 [Brachypodium distachyon]|eukprot:XP_014753124.1 protein Brevis radix-like 4 isoform X3 [Brachypodium distachyon]